MRSERIERGLVAFRTEVVAWEPPVLDELGEERRAPQTVSPHRPASRCVVCEQIAEVPYRYMAHAQWELARREERHAEHARSGGFCAMHTWQYAEIASHTGIALAYAGVTHALAERLPRHGRATDRATR